jgi:hypothetical protein
MSLSGAPATGHHGERLPTSGTRPGQRPGEARTIGEYLDFKSIVGITKHMGSDRGAVRA